MSFLSESIEKIINKEKKSSRNLSFLDDLNDNIVLEQEEEIKPIKEQLKDVQPYKVPTIEQATYYISSFWKKLYILENKDYKTGETLIWKIRWESKEKANENARKLYKLDYAPENLRLVEVAKDRLIDKVVANPTFFLSKKIDKMEMGNFFVEYASLLEDGLSKKQSVNLLKKTVKDKTLRDFLSELEDSSYKMSQLMLISWAFDEYTISIIQSSEATWGSRDFYTGLTKLGESYIQEETFRRDFIKSLYYPGILITAVILMGLGAIKFLIPSLAGIFDEVTNGNLPSVMIVLLQVGENLTTYIIQLIVIIIAIFIVKKVLFTNKQLMIRYELIKLKIPILWKILRISEENRVLSILIQTIQAQISAQQKIQFFQKASKSNLYNKVYQFMYKEYPNKQNLLGTMEESNKVFDEFIFSERLLLVLEVAWNETEKKLRKYKTFLIKNQNELKETLGAVQTLILTFTTIFIGASLAGLLMLIFSVVLGAIA